MKRDYRKSLLILFLFSLSFQAFSQAKYSNEFLNLGAGARGLGLGNAFTSLADDASAGYWNPSGLTALKENNHVSLMHAGIMAGIGNYDYASFATRLDSTSAFAVSVMRFGVDEIPDTRFLYDANGAINYNNIRFFSAADYAFIISYASEVKKIPGLSAGGNFKIVHRVAGNFASAWGFGFDLSARYSMNKWNLAIVGKDITGTFNSWSHNSSLVADVYAQTGNIIPETSREITLPKFIIGVNREFNLPENFSLTASTDIALSTDGKRNVAVRTDVVSFDPAFGLEVGYQKMFFLRTGVRNFQQIKGASDTKYLEFQPSMGLGLRIKRFQLDYAMSDIGNMSQALYSHIFSVGFSFGK